MASTQFRKEFATFALLLCCIQGTMSFKGGRKVKPFLHRTRNVWERSLKLGDYAQLGLDLHNTLREDHFSPPLSHNTELTASAQKTAENLVAAENFDGFTAFAQSRSEFPRFSQNVFNISDEWLASRPGFSILWAISDWYQPAGEYDYENPTPSSFTRLIWKSSTDLGIGLARKGNNTVIVANYAPPSEETVTPENVKLFRENVLKDHETGPDDEKNRVTV